MHHLEVVLKLLQQHKLFARMSKCSFELQQIQYLAHTVSDESVSMEKEKVQAVINWPIPLNMKQLGGSWDSQDTIEDSSKVMHL